jgi:hypothetical protein
MKMTPDLVKDIVPGSASSYATKILSYQSTRSYRQEEEVHTVLFIKA